MEARPPGFVARHGGGRKFQRDRLLQLVVVGGVDFAHAAPSCEAEDAIASGDNCSGGEAPIAGRSGRDRGGTDRRARRKGTGA